MKGYETFTKEKMVYLYKATKPITYKKLQNRIYFELSNHIDDMFCDFIDDGMSERDATEKFLNEMGSPEELGDELKKTHKDTLRLVKLIKRTTLLAVFVLIVSIFGVFEAKDNLDLAMHYNLPQETVELEKNLVTYTKLEYWSFPIDIYFYTNIDWHDLHTAKPIYKVKENNLFKDYYVLDESQSVLVDTFNATDSMSGVFYVDDINKLPRNYHSNKLSKAVLFNYNNDLTITPVLSPDEVLELEKLAILNDNDTDEELATEKLILSKDNECCFWNFQFHIKDLEGLYYTSHYNMYKSTDGKYYVGTLKLFSPGEACIYKELPESIGIKIEKAFEDAGIKFEDSKIIVQYE